MDNPGGTTTIFLVAMVVIFAAPFALWRLARADRIAPLVVVQIVAGIVLGPAVAGRLLPEYHDAVFTEGVIQALNGIAWWGVALFVWLAGVELDLKQAWANRRESIVTSALALAVPLLLGCLVASAMLEATGWAGVRASEWQFTLAVGMASAVTAMPVLILLLDQLAILRTQIGQRALRYASLDDIAIWGALALILIDLERAGLQCAFLLAFGACSYGYRSVMRRLGDEDRWHVGVLWLVLAALASQWVGLHFMIGAFLAGAVTDSSWFDGRRMDELRRHVLFFLMPVYFLSAGLRTDWGIDSSTVFLVASALVVTSIAGKLLGVWLAGRIFGWAQGEASLIGWLLQTKGLVMMVFASVQLDTEIITRETFTALLLMAIVSTALTVPVVARSQAYNRSRDAKRAPVL
jgi:Kef-type K+ transport system membrane component KefB